MPPPSSFPGAYSQVVNCRLEQALVLLTLLLRLRYIENMVNSDSKDQGDSVPFGPASGAFLSPSGAPPFGPLSSEARSGVTGEDQVPGHRAGC